MAQPLDRAVVQIDLTDHEAASLGQRVPNHRHFVVLRRHLDEAGFEVLDRMVGGVVAEGEAPGPRAGRATDDLVAEADSEERPAVGDDLASQRHRAVKSGRVAGTGREDHSVDVRGEGLRSRGGMWQDANASSAAPETADDVRLEAEVQYRDQRASLGGIPFVTRRLR